MSNQQSVEWLVEQMNNIKSSSTNMNGKVQFLEKELNNLFNQAKAMEKEQMCKFAYKCHRHYKVNGDFKIEQYYNETFKPE